MPRMAGCRRSAELGIAAASCLFLACALLLPLSAGNSAIFSRTPLPHIRRARPAQPCCAPGEDPGDRRHGLAGGLNAARGSAASRGAQSVAATRVNGKLPGRCGAGWSLCPLPSLRDWVLPSGVGDGQSTCPPCSKGHSSALPAECLLKLSQFPRALHSRAVSGPTPVHDGEGLAPDDFAAELADSAGSIAGTPGLGDGKGGLDPGTAAGLQAGGERPGELLGVPGEFRQGDAARGAPEPTEFSKKISEDPGQTGPQQAEGAQEGVGFGHEVGHDLGGAGGQPLLPLVNALPPLEREGVEGAAPHDGGQDMSEDRSTGESADLQPGTAAAPVDLPAKPTRVVPVGLEEFKRSMAQAAAATKSSGESVKPTEAGSGAPREGDDGAQQASSGSTGGGAAAKVPERRVHADGSRYNYASALHGAKVIATNPEAKRPGAVLDEDKDKYLRVPCSTKDKFLVIELSEYLTRIDSIVLSNYEYYSSSIKEFEVWGSAVYPTDQWVMLGSFSAKDVRNPQMFDLPENEGQFRFLMIRVRSHHGKEFYCTLSLVRVYGMDELESLREEMLALQGGTAPAGPASAAAMHGGGRGGSSDSANSHQHPKMESASAGSGSQGDEGSDGDEDELLQTPSGARERGSDAPEAQQGEDGRSVPGESASSLDVEPSSVAREQSRLKPIPGPPPPDGAKPVPGQAPAAGSQEDADQSRDARSVVSGEGSRGDEAPALGRLGPSEGSPAPRVPGTEDSHNSSAGTWQDAEDSGHKSGGSLAGTASNGNIGVPPSRSEETGKVAPTQGNTTGCLDAESSAQQADANGPQGTLHMNAGKGAPKSGPAGGTEAKPDEIPLHPDKSVGIPDAKGGLEEAGTAGRPQRDEEQSKAQASPQGSVGHQGSVAAALPAKAGAGPPADEASGLRAPLSSSTPPAGTQESERARHDANEVPNKDFPAQPHAPGSPGAALSSGTAPPPTSAPATPGGSFSNGLGSTAAATVSGLKAMMLRLKALEQNHSVLEQYVESVGSVYSRSLNDLDLELAALREQVQNLTATMSGLTKRLQHSDELCAQEKQALRAELQEAREQHKKHLTSVSEQILSRNRFTTISTQMCVGATLVCVLANLLALWWRRRTFEYYP